MTKKAYGAINWRFAIVLILTVVVLAVTAYTLRQHNRNVRARNGREIGLQKYQEGQWNQAANQLGRYLGLHQNDVDILMKYAQALRNCRPVTAGKIKQAIASYRIVLGLEPDNPEATRSLMEIFLAQSPDEAQHIAEEFLQHNGNEEIERLLAGALIRQKKYREACELLQSMVSENPRDIAAFEKLAQIAALQSEDAEEDAEYWIEKALAKNPENAQARLLRVRYDIQTLATVKTQALYEQQRQTILEQLAAVQTNDALTTEDRIQLARAYLVLDEMEPAREVLEAITADDKTRPAVWELKAQYAKKTAQAGIMKKTAEKGLAANRKFKWDFMPHAIELYILADDHAQARVCIDQLKSRDIRPDLTHYYQGLIHFEQGDLYQAIEDWRRSVSLGNSSQKLQLALAEAYKMVDDMQSAMQLMRRLLHDNPNNFEVLSNYARLLMEAGKWDEAAEQARLALTIEPGHKDMTVLYLRARLNVFEQQEIAPDSAQWSAVSRRIDRLYRENPRESAIGLLKLQSLLLQEDLAGAGKLVAELKKTFPDELSISLADVDLMERSGDTADAREGLQEIVRANPGDERAVGMLFRRYMQQENYTAAEKLVQNLLEHNPAPPVDKQFRMQLLAVYEKAQQPDKRHQLIDELVKDYPRDMTVRMLVLNEKLAEQDFAGAQKVIEQIKGLEGEEGWRWRYEQARVWVLSPEFEDKYNQAVTLLEENRRNFPQETNSLKLLAVVHEKKGQLNQAANAYLEAYQKDPYDLELIMATCDALNRAGKKEQANEILDRAVNDKLEHPELDRRKIMSYLDRGQIETGIDSLEGLVEKEPDNLNNRLLLARLKMSRGRLDEAAFLLEQLREEAPENLDILAGEIQLRLLQKQTDEALQLCDRYLAAHRTAEACLLRARVNRALKNHEAVDKDLRQALILAPDKIEVLLELYEHYRITGRQDEAVSIIQQALEIEPQNPAIVKRAISLFQSAPYPELQQQAEHLLTQALKVTPDDIDLNVFRARQLVASGTRPDLEKAEGILRQIVKRKPKTEKAWVMLGEMMLDQKNASKLMDVVLRGLVALPDNEELLFMKAHAESMQSPSLAVPTLKNLQKQNPGEMKYLLALTDAYFELRKWDEAAAVLRNNREQFSGEVGVILDSLHAKARYKKGEKPAALAELDRIAESSGGDMTPVRVRLEVLMDDREWTKVRQTLDALPAGQSDDPRFVIWFYKEYSESPSSSPEALAVVDHLIDRGLQAHPNQIQIILIEANHLLDQKRYDEAVAAYERILEQEPDHILAINNMTWILTRYQRNHQAALELSRRGLEIDPDYLDLVDTQGLIYYNLGEYEKALQNFQKCLDLYPRSARELPSCHLHQAQALFQLNRKNDALKHVNLALELNDSHKGLSEQDIQEAGQLKNKLVSER